MRNLLILAMNTLKITFRKKSNIIVYLILPVVIIIFVMTAYGSSSSKINIGINNKDINGALAKDFIEEIKNQDRYRVRMVEEKEINKLVADSSVECVLTIPENFDESIYNNNFSKLDIFTIKGEDATGFIQSYVNYYIKNLLSLSKASDNNKDSFNKLYVGFKTETLKLSTNLVKDQSLNKRVAIASIGFLIMFMLQGASTTAGLILKEKRERTYFRIFSSPVDSKIYIGANILANMFMMLIQSILVIVSMKYIFNFNMGVPGLQLLVILVTFGLVCVTLGIFIVAFSSTSYQASTMATIIFVPTCMISGCYWPKELMPDFMQKIANFLPQTWALEAIKQLQEGKTFIDVIPCLAILIAFALSFFLIGMYKMKISSNVKNFI
ncbi:MAG: ABC transporter permease [Clostridiaceae bacterium]|nr:ABC transporter permease [Clostridiaceae bacterium]